jgi:hypothetical protein
MQRRHHFNPVCAYQNLDRIAGWTAPESRRMWCLPETTRAAIDVMPESGKPLHTDEDRLGQMERVFYDGATRHQLLIFTCHSAAWRDLAVSLRAIAA